MRPIRFIAERVDVELPYESRPSKKPAAPVAFVWRGERYAVTELLSEWRDYGRRGKMERNMRPEHAARAEQTGSWGVGRQYHRVRTDAGRIFDLYYDRAPRSATDRAGAWYLFRELEESEATGE
ncbi:MAG: hypothetical protein GF400_10375 [Candidatus Eisenbacteria bacterium]|nr:hypothetical protein [Candidatus Eisenbacteria bacterium]